MTTRKHKSCAAISTHRRTHLRRSAWPRNSRQRKARPPPRQSRFTPLADENGNLTHRYWERFDRSIDYIWVRGIRSIGIVLLVVGVTAMPGCARAEAPAGIYRYGITHPSFGDIGVFTNMITRDGDRVIVATTALSRP